MEHIPELLAPVGGLAQLHAAVNNGADAVYLGGARFNARAKAENFTLPRLRDAIDYAHERNVKIYVTFNTLLKDRELPDALDYAGALWDIGADAVIVQDMGLVRMLGKYLPELPLHLSTQGTVTGRWAVDLMKDFGIRRIVPARELSIQEIREMAEACHGTEAAEACYGTEPAGGRGQAPRPYCELEVFVHGALCMCYSGQCQMSRILGGGRDTGEGDRAVKGSVRSGNRGLCAQPCRLPYTDDQGRHGYFLSPKDLCLLEDLPVLSRAGVDSLKIEGRLKSAEYVAVVTGIYRKYLDRFAETGSIRVSDEDRRDLTQIYNRGGFTKGYLYGNPGENLLSGASPKNSGIYIGTVRSVVDARSAGKDRAAAAGAAKKNAVLVDVALREQLAEGDGVEFRSRHAAKPARILKEAMKPAGGVVTFRRALSGGVLRIGDMKGTIRPGDEAFRVTDRALLERARATFDAEDPAELDRRMRRRIPLEMRFEAASGAPAVLEIREIQKVRTRRVGAGAEKPQVIARVLARVRSQEVLEPAHTRPADPERIRQQLGKLGGTPFTAAPEDIHVELDGLCAVSIGEINRMRRDGIDQSLHEKRKMDRRPADLERLASAGSELAQQQLSVPVLPDVTAVPLMQFMECDEMAVRVLPYIDAVSKGALDAYIMEHFQEIVQRLKAADAGILIRGNSWIRQFLDAGVKVYGGHGLNIYNEEARLAYEELGVTVLELSHETGYAGLSGDGRIPLMITEHPVQSKTLTDRKGQVHRIERSPAGDKTIIW